jgi:4-amino-4-deoxy-L-arabinose transferase-like glycosyltransferase
MPSRTPRWLLAASFVLFATWSLVVPINEAPDELAHWQYARYLRDHWRLPQYAPGFEEANSPPLAYALFAPLATDSSSSDVLLARRPDGTWWSMAPPRTFLNTDQDFLHFWRQRLARLVACAISVVTVLFVWRAGVVAGGPAVGLLAALFVALLPMFAFRAGHVSNDALLGCFAAIATWGMVRHVREPFTWRVALLSSAAVGLAYMSKISAIALVPPFALALLAAEPAATWRVRAWRLSALALAGAIVGPWSIRNVVLYGDPFASDAMRTAVAHIITDRPLFSRFFIDEFPRGLTKSFIGIFGWGRLEMPPWTYRPYVLLFMVGIALAGLATYRRRLDWRLAAVLGATGLAALAVVVRINLQFTQLQGRYLMPAVPAFAVLLGLGFQSLPTAFAGLGWPRLIGSLLVAGNLYALFGVVVPAYYPSPTRTLANGTRVMLPTNLVDLALLDGESHFLVIGKAPHWTAPIAADSAAFAAFEVELQAPPTIAQSSACVRVGPTVDAMKVQPPVCVPWLPDGTPQTVRIHLRGTPGWSGEVSHIRLDLFGDGSAPLQTAVRAIRPRLVPPPSSLAP